MTKIKRNDTRREPGKLEVGLFFGTMTATALIATGAYLTYKSTKKLIQGTANKFYSGIAALW